MKKIINLVLSADIHPYKKMVETSLQTWDSIEIAGVETIYYFGKSAKENTHNMIYLDIPDTLYNMGKKLIMALEWVLDNKEFDYISRPHSCIYVDKKELINYVQTLPNENVFSCLKVDTTPVWGWGGCGFVLSRDVVEKIVINKHLLDVTLMEDMALSYIINELNIPYTQGKGCSIDKVGNGWLCLMYGHGTSFEFTSFEDIIKAKGQYFFRVKNDGDRRIDEIVMHNIFNYLK